jgi:glyoxylase-like metal-dependent hydrolase (beta-lactamase superfamily II)
VFTPLDVNFLGHPRIIASCLLESGRGGVTLIDPGPSTSLDGLRAALASRSLDLSDVDTILLTHIHLDHAGGTGTILRRHPRIQVYVHERGAPHMVEPSRLMTSAARLYGADMERLWGEMAPVPEANVHAVRGGECIRAAGRDLRVEYTPGHASHHVSYFDPETRTAFAGDTAGVRVGAPLLVLPPTPPPDVDFEAWDVSIDRILAWQPERVFVTHFGAFEAPAEHLSELRARSREWIAKGTALLADATLSDEERMARFANDIRGSITGRVGQDAATNYSLAIPFQHCWLGLARYLRRKAEAGGR